MERDIVGMLGGCLMERHGIRSIRVWNGDEAVVNDRYSPWMSRVGERAIRRVWDQTYIRHPPERIL